jgi:antitoxin component YwqK of YwqJK toxin-antitoxin module
MEEYIQHIKTLSIAKQYTNTIEPLERLEEFCSKYNYNDYFYKKCRNNRFVILKTIEGVTRCNDNRKDIVNPQYARYRIDKAHVVYICDIFNPLNAYEDAISKWDKNFIYRINEDIESKYDENINEIETEGIHVFKTVRPAFQYQLLYDHIEKRLPGILVQMDYYDNGVIDQFYSITKKGYIGAYIHWYTTGIKSSESYYLDDKLDGFCTDYDEHGLIESETTYLYGWEIGTSYHYYKGILEYTISYDLSEFILKGYIKTIKSYANGKIKQNKKWHADHSQKMEYDKEYAKKMYDIFSLYSI